MTDGKRSRKGPPQGGVQVDWPSILTAAATAFAAIAAVFSAVAAFRQENATYESQLYNGQVDAVAKFAQAVDETRDNSHAWLQQIVAARNDAPSSRADLRRRVVDQTTEIEKATGVFSLIFPLAEFRPLELNLKNVLTLDREFIDSLDQNRNVPHVKYDDPNQAAEIFTRRYNKTALCVRLELAILVECAKRRLGDGRAIRKDFAFDCANSSYSAGAKDSRASDSAECYER